MIIIFRTEWSQKDLLVWIRDRIYGVEIKDQDC